MSRQTGTIRAQMSHRGTQREASPSPRRNGKASPITRRTPYLQGQIDGLCGLYAIVNAFQWLFPTSFTDDDAWELMTILCGAIAHKFPAVIWKGAGVEDTVLLFKAAEKYAAKTPHLKGLIVVTTPFARRKIDRAQDFWAEIGDWLEAAKHAQTKRLACIGIGYPDNHWTVVTKTSAKSVTFFDSWELKRLALRQFTISQDVAKANGGMHKLDTRQTFLIERKPMSGEG
jgi:hypothetical protein